MNNLKICLLFTLSINILSYSQVISEDEVTNYAINNIEEFVEFLSYPNDANNKEDIEKLIDWTSNRFNKLGFDTKRLQTESVPLLLAELVYKKSYNTILIYLHLDGQPVDNSKWHQENPYKPVLKAPDINGEFVIIDWENLNNKTIVCIITGSGLKDPDTALNNTNNKVIDLEASHDNLAEILQNIHGIIK